MARYQIPPDPRNDQGKKDPEKRPRRLRRDSLNGVQEPIPWRWLGLGLLAVYVRGLFLDVMDVDASQYASISMEMLQNGQWLQVQHRHAGSGNPSLRHVTIS